METVCDQIWQGCTFQRNIFVKEEKTIVDRARTELQIDGPICDMPLTPLAHVKGPVAFTNDCIHIMVFIAVPTVARHYLHWNAPQPPPSSYGCLCVN